MPDKTLHFRGDLRLQERNGEWYIENRNTNDWSGPINLSELNLELDEESGDQSLIQLGGQTETKTDGNLFGSSVDLKAETNDDVRGHTSITVQSGDGGRNIGGRAYLYSNGPSHNQTLGYYARIVQKSGSDGALPPSAAFYADSSNSDYRPFALFIDDGESIWEKGIILNGDYKEELIRGPNADFVLFPNGDIDTAGEITQQGDKQPRLRELHRNVPASGTTETFDLNTEIPRTNDSWMIYISSQFPDGDTQYSERGYEGQFRFYSGYDVDGNNFERVTEVIPATGFDEGTTSADHTCSVDPSGIISYSGGTVSFRSEIVVKARKLS